MKAFDPNYKLLDEMYQDDYYPAFLVDKVKDEQCRIHGRDGPHADARRTRVGRDGDHDGSPDDARHFSGAVLLH